MSPGCAPEHLAHRPVSTRSTPECLAEKDSGIEPLSTGPCAGAPGVHAGDAGLKLASQCTDRSCRVETGLPVKISVHTGFAPIENLGRRKR
jgi:hypothetical protein